MNFLSALCAIERDQGADFIRHNYARIYQLEPETGRSHNVLENYPRKSGINPCLAREWPANVYCELLEIFCDSRSPTGVLFSTDGRTCFESRGLL